MLASLCRPVAKRPGRQRNVLVSKQGAKRPGDESSKVVAKRTGARRTGKVAKRPVCLRTSVKWCYYTDLHDLSSERAMAARFAFQLAALQMCRLVVCVNFIFVWPRLCMGQIGYQCLQFTIWRIWSTENPRSQWDAMHYSVIRRPRYAPSRCLQSWASV